MRCRRRADRCISRFPRGDARVDRRPRSGAAISPTYWPPSPGSPCARDSRSPDRASRRSCDRRRGRRRAPSAAAASGSWRRHRRLPAAAIAAFGLSPASPSRTLSGTPVCITQCTMPWVNCTPLSCAPRHSMPELAAHSQKYARLTRGMRLMSSRVKISGRRPGRAISAGSRRDRARRCRHDGARSTGRWA